MQPGTELVAVVRPEFDPHAVSTLQENAVQVLLAAYRPFVKTENLPAFVRPETGSVLPRLVDDTDAKMTKNPFVTDIRRGFDELYSRGAFKGAIPEGLEPQAARTFWLTPFDRAVHRDAALERLILELRQPEKDFNAKTFQAAVDHLPEHMSLPPRRAHVVAADLAQHFANSVISREGPKMRGYDAVSRFVGLPETLDARMVTSLSRCLTHLASGKKNRVNPDPKDVADLMQATLAISQEIVNHNRANPTNQKGFENVSTTVNNLVAAAEKMLMSSELPSRYKDSAVAVLGACGRKYVEPQRVFSHEPSVSTKTSSGEPNKTPIVVVDTHGTRKNKVTTDPSDPTNIPDLAQQPGRVVTIDVADWLHAHRGTARTAAAAAMTGAILITNVQGAAAATSEPKSSTGGVGLSREQQASAPAAFGSIVIISSGAELGSPALAPQAAPASPPASPDVRFSAVAPKVFGSADALGAVAVAPRLGGEAGRQPEVGAGQIVVEPKKASLPPDQETALSDAAKHAEALTVSTRELADSLLRQFQGTTGATLKDNNRVSKMLLGVADTVSNKDGDFTVSAKNYIAHAVVASQLPDVFDNSKTKEVYDILLKSLPGGIAVPDQKYISQYTESIIKDLLATEQFSAGKGLYTQEQLQKLARLVALSNVHNLNAQELSDIIAKAKAAEAAQQPADPAPAQTQAPKAPVQPAPAEDKPTTPSAENPSNPEVQQAALKKALGEFKVPQEYIDLFIASADKYGIPVAITVADAHAESGFRKDAVGPMTKSGTAKGIAQIIDGTWNQIVKDLNFPPDASPFDVQYAIPGQAYYLSQQLKSVKSALAAGKIQGDPYELMLAGYNAGFGNVLKYNGIPPFKETQNYVKKIMNNKEKIDAMAAGQAADAPQPKAEAPATPEGAGGEWHGTLIAVRDNGKITGYKPGEKVPDTWKGQIYYNQHDERWGKDPYQKEGQNNRVLTTSGCGPTSQAMVYSNLLDRSILPKEVAQFNVDNGFRAESGTSHGAFAAGAKYYGLQSKQLDPHSLDQIKRITDAGGYVITNGTDNDPETPGTKGGHIFVIRGVTADGEILVLDPNSFAKTTVAYDPKDIFAASTVAVAIFK
jgi:soluble lytic murein transglycosylase-like protein